MRKYQGEVHQTTGSLQFIWKLYSIFLKIIHILDLICSPEQKSTKALKRSRQSKYSRITCCLGQGQYWLENQKAILLSCSWSNSTSVSDSLHQTYLWAHGRTGAWGDGSDAFHTGIFYLFCGLRTISNTSEYRRVPGTAHAGRCAH